MDLEVPVLRRALEHLSEADAPAAVRTVAIPGFPDPVARPGDKLTGFSLELLLKNRIPLVSVRFSRKLLSALHQVDPVHFPMPHAVEGGEEFMEKLRAVDFANRHSRYQRTLFSCMELEDEHGGPLLSYNQAITLEHWTKVRPRWPEATPVAFRFSEHKILLFLNLKLTGENYLRRFLHNVKMIETLSGKMNEFREFVNIHRLDFERDVLVVDRPDELLDVYRQSDVRLILIGDGVEGPFRDALVKVKKYDPYARFMLARSANPSEEAVFLMAVEDNYSRDNYR